jgi:hypothetical protein
VSSPSPLASSLAKSGDPLAGIVAEPPPARARDPIARDTFFPRADMQIKGIFLNMKNFPGTFLKIRIFNSEAFMPILVKSVENIRKSENYKLNFVGFLEKNPTTFLKHDLLLSDGLCLKNRNQLKLDLL